MRGRAVSPRRVHDLTGVPWRNLEDLAATAGAEYAPFDTRAIGTDGVIGKWRHIDEPKRNLKSVQGILLQRFLTTVPLPERMFGARRGASILDHAAVHIGQECIATLDLRTCFPRTSFRSVYSALCETYGCTPDVARCLTRLTTLHRRLPQGAPTSPYLAHVTLMPLYAELRALAHDNRLRVSFYVDDLAISGTQVRVNGVMGSVIDAIHRHGHSIRNSKKHVMLERDKLVTNLFVGDRVEIRSDYVTDLESALVKAIRTGELTVSSANSLLGKVRWVKAVSPQLTRGIDELLRHVPTPAGRGAFPKSEQRRCSGTRDCRASRICWGGTQAA